MKFTLEDLKLYVYGQFECVDDVPGNEYMAEFLAPLIQESYEDFQGMSAEEMADNSVVEDVLIGLHDCSDPSSLDALFARASERYNIRA